MAECQVAAAWAECTKPAQNIRHHSERSEESLFGFLANWSSQGRPDAIHRGAFFLLMGAQPRGIEPVPPAIGDRN